jgi:hypothetical protein
MPEEEEDSNFVIVYHMNHARKIYIDCGYPLMNDSVASIQIFYSHE